MVASMDEHWVDEMGVLTDATWAVCSAAVTGGPWVVVKDAPSAAP